MSPESGIVISPSPDPVTGTVQAVANAVTAVCQLLCTPEGQASLKEARENTDAFKALTVTIGNWIQGLVTGKL